MCGRYQLSRRKQIIEEQLDTADWQDDWNPRYNIAPTQFVPPAPTGADSSAFDYALGTDSVVGEGHVRRGENDQR
jgi:putative SOS response-associated peptidase YedK